MVRCPFFFKANREASGQQSSDKVYKIPIVKLNIIRFEIMKVEKSVRFAVNQLLFKEMKKNVTYVFHGKPKI